MSESLNNTTKEPDPSLSHNMSTRGHELTRALNRMTKNRGLYPKRDRKKGDGFGIDVR
jgi:hypothetical protein